MDIPVSHLAGRLCDASNLSTGEELKDAARDYCILHAITEPEDIRAFELGAILAQSPHKYDRIRGEASEEEMTVLEREYTHKWSQPKLLYLVIVLCSTCAAVQGMVSNSESVLAFYGANSHPG